jgi:hypothetical protein
MSGSGQRKVILDIFGFWVTGEVVLDGRDDPGMTVSRGLEPMVVRLGMAKPPWDALKVG